MCQQDHGTVAGRGVPGGESNAVFGDEVEASLWNFIFSQRIPRRDDARRMQRVVHFDEACQNCSDEQYGNRLPCKSENGSPRFLIHKNYGNQYSN